MKLSFDRADLTAVINAVPANKPTAEIYIVKDEGIYLMSFGEEKPANAAPTWARTVAYANGFNPNKDGDLHDKCRAAVGGDDIGEVIGTRAEFQKILDDSVGDIAVNITSASLGVSYKPKTPATTVTVPHAYKALEIFKGDKSGKWRIVHSARADGKPVLYAVAYPKKSDASAFVKSLKADARFKAMHDDMALRSVKAVA